MRRNRNGIPERMVLSRWRKSAWLTFEPGVRGFCRCPGRPGWVCRQAARVSDFPASLYSARPSVSAPRASGRGGSVAGLAMRAGRLAQAFNSRLGCIGSHPSYRTHQRPRAHRLDDLAGVSRQRGSSTGSRRDKRLRKALPNNRFLPVWHRITKSVHANCRRSSATGGELGAEARP
jgi:ribosomal protein L39E